MYANFIKMLISQAEECPELFNPSAMSVFYISSDLGDTFHMCK